MLNSLFELPKVLAHLEHTTFDHNFHPIYGNTSYLINSLFESNRGLLQIQFDVVFFPGMFNVYFEGSHDRCPQTRNDLGEYVTRQPSREDVTVIGTCDVSDGLRRHPRIRHPSSCVHRHHHPPNMTI